MLHVMHSISACKKELHVHVILHIQGNQAKQSRFPYFFSGTRGRPSRLRATSDLIPIRAATHSMATNAGNKIRNAKLVSESASLQLLIVIPFQPQVAQPASVARSADFSPRADSRIVVLLGASRDTVGWTNLPAIV
jgi:hypothetical protein